MARDPKRCSAAKRKRGVPAVAPSVLFPGFGWLVWDRDGWRPGSGPDGFAWPSFDGRRLGGNGRGPPRGKGAQGDPHGVGDFLEKVLAPAPGERVASAALLVAVNEARRQAGCDPVTSRRLADELKRRGVKQTKSNRVFWLDIKLAPRPPPRGPPRRSRRPA